MEAAETQNNSQNHDREAIFAKAVRAGKRTYFFDVRTTKNSDFYLTITESKRKYNDDGTFNYQKHKIFLYKEDFEKFTDALAEALKKVVELHKEKGDVSIENMSGKFTDISFEDLGGSGGVAKADAEK